MKRMVVAIIDTEADSQPFIASAPILEFSFDGLIESAGNIIDDVCETYELTEGVANYELPE